MGVTGCALDPWFITGFVDGEGSFMIRVRKNSKYPNSIINFSGFRQQRKYSMLTSESLINESLPNKSTIQPWFVTGFVDGEGCFVVSVYKSDKNKIGWRWGIKFPFFRLAFYFFFILVVKTVVVCNTRYLRVYILEIHNKVFFK